MVDHAQQSVPYYEEAYGKLGLRAQDIEKWDDLLEVPTIGKRQIASNFPDRITARQSNRDTWQYFATSGTTDRLMVVKDTETLSRNLALSQFEEKLQGTYSPGLLRVDIPPDACSLACAAAVHRSLGTLGRAKQAIQRLKARDLSDLPRSIIGHTVRNIATPTREMASFGPEGTRVSPEMLEWYADKIRRWRPSVLSGLPTYLLLLARHIIRSGKLPPSVGYLLPQGALSPEALKKEINQVFGVPVHEVYGGHEFGCVASTCEFADKMHVLMPECLVEIVRNGKHALPGELGEIVVTSFTNRVMPLIRYRPGDVGRLYENHCRCGRQTQLLLLEGRMEDTLVTSAGIRTEKEISNYLMTWPDLDFTQLVQRNDTQCDLLVVPKDGRETNLSDLSGAMKELLGGEMNVRPRVVSTIKPEVSGKFRYVISTSFGNFHETRAPKAAFT
jgi:phenylacetate-CoA ligase